MLLLSALAHHGEPIDPELMDWIRHQIDAIFGLGPEAIVLLLGFLIVLAPIVVLAVYARQRLLQGRDRR
ncbi:MAG: hypothetical protein QGG34_03705 [SAR202 cluster bacterium]|jgi:hypothetical protein|nr:hypothetical protein [SAR202 cluster bacterium]MDP6300769.1 hypothetical protein [SAR202 cluster bacterium]MDP7102136.1 hypothetical protein [SAR202 cluster bacterium]MDP7224073.1 hypothetical protein [SAR202 cluster bacterium]MDP7412358.1 hypothetical protein [SAR202 cluster bacterium]|tara:strand:- start:2973 stop:3179 length:207 start_codon:yes stop_codon:yes gene_type:complete